jgi:RND family efflux transporter MFP subunit
MEPEKTPDAKAPVSGDQNPGASAEPSKHGHWKIILILCVAVAIVVALVVWKSRSHPTVEQPSSVVGVAKVTREDLFNTVPIPAEFRPYVEVELHAKVSGYVDKMNVDFGDRVKSNQLLATLEVPELHDQLHNAVAVRQKAEADYTNAHLMYTRLLEVSQKNPNLVAQQDLDTAQAKDGSTFSAIAAAKADVDRYQTLVKYTQITAPFDGVVTHRYADPGALIQAGTSSDTQSMPLVRVSDNYLLRLDFPVSVDYVKDIHPGAPIQVRIESLDDKMVTGTVTRFTDKITLDTRTMIVEIEVPNPTLEIVPGMYAALDLKVRQVSNALAVPVGAIGESKNPTVYVINGDSVIESRPVKLGLETPDKYEVVSGLKEGELVMIGNRAFVHPGEKVETKLVGELKYP